MTTSSTSKTASELTPWQPRFRNPALWALLFLGFAIAGLHPSLGERALGFRLLGIEWLSEGVGLWAGLTFLFCVLQGLNLYDQERNSLLIRVDGKVCRIAKHEAAPAAE